MTSIEQIFAPYFKAETRHRGDEEFRQGLVTLNQNGDQEVRAYVKASAPIRVAFSADEVAAVTFRASCTCTTAKKGQACKHIWATLKALQDKGSDFLEGKAEITISEGAAARTSTFVKREPSPAFTARREEQKERARAYGKAMRQKQKDRRRQATAEPEAEVDPALAEALAYFAQNGFEFRPPLDAAALKNAKRTLAQVFHPDKGGTHEETLTLNQHFETLYNWPVDR